MEIPYTETESELHPVANRLVVARLFIGFIVLLCAEGLSGSSIHIGFWNPWTLVVTYWLYFAHFFFFTTCAIRTGKMGLPALYLWGVLFGLYESWITKVIWSGYEGDGKFALGHIGPFGYAEISMVFLFHPVVSFLLPLCILGCIAPTYRRAFPELAWFMGRSRGASWIQLYSAIAFVSVMALLSGGPIILLMNAAFVSVVGYFLWTVSKKTLANAEASAVLAFGNRGMLGLVVYLALLYGVAYVKLRPDDLPSVGVQLFTGMFYAITIGGLVAARRATNEPVLTDDTTPWPISLRTAALLIVILLVSSALQGNPILSIAVLPHFIVWTPLGFALTVWALVRCVRERLG